MKPASQSNSRASSRVLRPASRVPHPESCVPHRILRAASRFLSRRLRGNNNLYPKNELRVWDVTTALPCGGVGVVSVVWKTVINCHTLNTSNPSGSLHPGALKIRSGPFQRMTCKLKKIGGPNVNFLSSIGVGYDLY